MPPPRGAVNLDILTQSYRVSCRLNAGANGLIGLLNDANTALLELEEAYYSRLEDPAKIVARLPTAHMVKKNAAMLVLTRQEDLGPQGLARGGFTRLLPVPVLITMPGYEIQGSVEVVSKFDASQLLVAGTGLFISVYGANAMLAANPETIFSGAVILVNRSQIQLLAPVVRAKA
jgi:hypothetical protein